MWGALALEDAGSSLEPTASQGIVGCKLRESFGIEGAEGSRSVEGEGLEGPVALGEEWG